MRSLGVRLYPSTLHSLYALTKLQVGFALLSHMFQFTVFVFVRLIILCIIKLQTIKVSMHQDLKKNIWDNDDDDGGGDGANDKLLYVHDHDDCGNKDCLFITWLWWE